MPSPIRFAIDRAIKSTSRNAAEEGAEGFFKAGAKKAKKRRKAKPKIGVTLKKSNKTYTDPVTKKTKNYYVDAKGMLYRPVQTAKGAMMLREDGVLFSLNKSTGRWVPEGK